MKKNIQGEFQICISVALKKKYTKSGNLGSLCYQNSLISGSNV